MFKNSQSNSLARAALLCGLALLAECQSPRERFFAESRPVTHRSCETAPTVSGAKGECTDRGCNLGKCIEGSCQEGSGVMAFPSSSRYSGTFKGGRFWGYGIVSLCDGSIYEGEFVNDEPHGSGRLTFSDGSRFNGEVQHGLPHGDGWWISATGDYRYDGSFQRGARTGTGTAWTADGFYQGQFVNGLFHGSGRRNKNGLEHQGQWKQGLPIGSHVLADPSGGTGFVEFDTTGKAIRIVSAREILQAELDFNHTMWRHTQNAGLREDPEFCRRFMLRASDFSVGLGSNASCRPSCEKVCGNMWARETADWFQCGRQCRKCWTILDYPGNDCRNE